MQASLLITTFERDELLAYGLASISQQAIMDTGNVEIIVLNDGYNSPETEEISLIPSARYFWTGQHKHARWRVPGYALNIGARQAKGEWLILSCAEMFHINSCIKGLLETEDEKALSIPRGWDDDGRFLESLRRSEKFNYTELGNLRIELPFLLTVHRKKFLDIGGYDEDFTGQSYDDDDLIMRLLESGCYYRRTEERCIHLFHNRNTADKRAAGRLEHNKKLFETRQGQVFRNEGRRWGQLL